VKKLAAIFIDIQQQIALIQGVSFHNSLVNQNDLREKLGIQVDLDKIESYFSDEFFKSVL
jgi:hypothetical protein